jgi:hypothetical protein
MEYRTVERWQQLSATQPGEGGIPSIDSGVSSGYGQVRFALGPDGERRLLIPVGQDVFPEPLSSSANLRLSVIRLSLQHTTLRYVDLQCTNRQLDQVFAELADAILHRIEHGITPMAAIAGALTEFRELLRGQSQVLVPIEQILGLIGELLVLQRLTRHTASCVAAWTGPFEQRHDFRRGRFAIEVKTSARADATRVHINGISQLAEPDGGKLLLMHVRLERADAGPLTVGALVKQLTHAGVDALALERALAEMGCENPSDPAWNQIAWTLEGMTPYLVRLDFPRIVASTLDKNHLPTGISNLNYELDLSVATDFVLAPQQLETYLEEMME